MTCRDLAECLLEYLTGELESERCQRLRAHLETCPECVTYIETYQITVQISRQLPRSPIPAELLKRLEEALKQMGPGPEDGPA